MNHKEKLPSSGEKFQSPQEKVRYLLQVVLVCLALLFLSSCGSYLPQAQEMGNMALLRSFAVDKGDTWQVTVSTGTQGNDIPEPLLLQGEGLTLQGACDNINQYSKDYVFYGYVDQLLLGRELASQGVEKVLQYFATQEELSLGTGIWLCQGDALDLLEHSSDQGTSEHLRTLREESHLGTGGITRQVGEVYGDLLEQGASFLPLVKRSDQGLEQGGYGILKGEVLVDLFQGEEAQGLELWMSHPQLLELNLSQGAYAVQLEEYHWKVEAHWEGDTLQSIAVEVDIQADLLEGPPYAEGDILPHLEAKIDQLCSNTLLRLQEQEADVLALGEKIRFPSKELASLWQEYFPTVLVDTKVSVSWIA